MNMPHSGLPSRVLIENYRNLTAEHCGSGSLRNLVYHYCGLELSEAVVFGLGAGLDCMYIPVPGMEPPFMLFGRGEFFEVDFAAALDLDYVEQEEPDDRQAWIQVAEQVVAGKPTMLSGDIFYLDYRNYTVNFPGHRFVLLGYDEERQETYIADRINEETEVCSMEGLRQCRNAPVGVSSNNRWGRFDSGRVGNSLEDACGIAIKNAAETMLGVSGTRPASQFGKIEGASGGLSGFLALRKDMRDWPMGKEAVAYARNIENNIVKFGTGGAFFRNLYTGFLEWSRDMRPDLVNDETVGLCRKSASLWNEMAVEMKRINDTLGEGDCWEPALPLVERIHDTERQLFEVLADKTF